MNSVQVVKQVSSEIPIETGQIYQMEEDFYMVVVVGINEKRLINLRNGIHWSNEPVEETLTRDKDFVLFRGTIQITTDY